MTTLSVPTGLTGLVLTLLVPLSTTQGGSDVWHVGYCSQVPVKLYTEKPGLVKTRAIKKGIPLSSTLRLPSKFDFRNYQVFGSSSENRIKPGCWLKFIRQVHS